MNEDLDAIEMSLAALRQLMPGAVEVQWIPSPKPKPREDTGERSSGGPPSDPTADVALDPDRLAVRASVVNAERVARHCAELLAAAVRKTERALREWEGDEDA